MSGEVDYTLSLALVDIIPVVLTGIGTVYLARAAGRRLPSVFVWGLTGAVLIVTGGACKAVWKLIIASTTNDVTWLDDLLFVFLMPGFALLAWALMGGLRQAQVRRWPYVIGVVAPAVVGAFLRKPFPLTLGTSVFLVVTTVAAAVLAHRLGDDIAVGAFVLQLALVPVLVFLGSPRITQSTGQQWIEEMTNAVAQGALAFGAIRLFGKCAHAAQDSQLQEV